MPVSTVIEFGAMLLAIILLAPPFGGYLLRVFNGGKTRLDPLLVPLERTIYRICRVDATVEMSWSQYALAFVMTGLVGTLMLYFLLRVQQWLPFYDAAILTNKVTPDLGMNTAISFATTTTWQAYAGESTLSYVSQTVGLAVQNCLAGAAGLCTGVACIRGLARQESGRLGNFWVDLVRGVLWVIFPVWLALSLVLVWQGVPMNLDPYVHATTLEGVQQIIPQGPVASFEVIKNLGTNGGGWFGANGAHPYENPTPLANFLEMLAIVVLPASLTHMLGQWVRLRRQGWMLFWVMMVLFVGGMVACQTFEQRTPPYPAASALEGKETRFGIGSSVLNAVVTTNGATGSYNSLFDSYSPMGCMVTLVNMLLGEMIFGGLGTGLYSMLMVVFLALFLSGLMVGRTPEYLGKQVSVREIKYVVLYTLAMPMAVLGLSALAVVTPAGLAGLTTNNGAHGLTEILYAYTSCVANNGATMGGLSVATPFYNVTTSIAMMVGRYALAVPALALFGEFAAQRKRPITMGTLPTDTPLFAVVVIGTCLIVVALSYFPALALGPVVEHLRTIR